MALINLMRPTSHIRLCCGYWMCRAGPGSFTPQPSLTSSFKRDMTNYSHWVLLFVATGFAGRFRADLRYKLNPTSSWPLYGFLHVMTTFKFSSIINFHVTFQVMFFMSFQVRLTTHNVFPFVRKFASTQVNQGT